MAEVCSIGSASRDDIRGAEALLLSLLLVVVFVWLVRSLVVVPSCPLRSTIRNGVVVVNVVVVIPCGCGCGGGGGPPILTS